MKLGGGIRLPRDEEEDLETSEKTAQKYVFAKVAVLSIFTFIQFAFPSASLNDPLVWFFVWWLDIWCMLDVWTYLRLKSIKNPILSGLRYYVAFGASMLGVFGLFLLGASQIFLRAPNFQAGVMIFEVYLGFLLFIIVGFMWMEVWEKFKNPYQFLARYCTLIQIVFLLLVLSTTVIYTGSSFSLFEVAWYFPSDSLWVYCCIFITAVSCFVYLTQIGGNKWIRRLSAIIPLVNMVLFFHIWIYFEDKLASYGLLVMILSLMMILSGGVPQMFWALNERVDYTHIFSILQLLKSVGNSFRIHKVRRVGSPIVYKLLFLNDRIVFFRVPPLLAAGIDPYTLLGGTIANGETKPHIETVLDEELKYSLENAELKIEELSKASVDELLRMDKKNFEIKYEDIVRIEIIEPKTEIEVKFRAGILLIDGKEKLKFDIAPDQKVEKCKEIIKKYALKNLA